MYSIVLVLRPFSHHQDAKFNNIERFVSTGMVTLDRFMKREEVQDFFVVVPPADVAEVQRVLTDKFPAWPWKILNEETLIHSALPPGWCRQQTAKLAISMLVQTDNYLIIDDDTFLTKPFCEKDMRDPANGKLIMNRTQIDFPFFYLWSNQVLKFDFDKVQDFKYFMGITPEIFVTSVVKDIVKWLVQEYGGKKMWQLHLLENKYTEYTLYWIWLIKNGLVDELYTDNPQLEVYGNCMVNDDTISNMKRHVARAFSENGSYWFSFVQSSLKFDVKDVRDAVLAQLTP